VPFREAHGVVASLVATALESGRSLSQLSTEELAGQSEALAAVSEQYYELLTQSSRLESKVSQGGTALARVREQLTQARGVLGGDRRTA
jgi:argininosuccinate lyase